MRPENDRPADLLETEEFQRKVVQDTSGLTVTVMSAVGDKLNLFKHLARTGPIKSDAFALETGIHPRYAQEWLSIMTSASYIHYDPNSQLFSLPPAHARVLADEGGPFFIGGTHQMLLGMLDVTGLLEDAFRSGEGVPMLAYGADTWEGMERDMNGVYAANLIQKWIPAMPEVASMLERGADVVDIGCGSGRVLIMLAEKYPNSNFVGLDFFEPVIERATANAEAAGVENRIEFVVGDAIQGLTDDYDIIMTFEVLHDAAQPVKLLQAIRQNLRDRGRFVCMEIESSEKLEDNHGPLATVRYGASILYCMSTSLADGGAGLGTMGVNESKMKELCAEAGFGRVRKVPLENSIHSIYEVQK